MDRLEIQIEAEAKAASSEIDSLYQKLGNVANVLKRTSTANRSCAKEVGRLASAFRTLADASIPNFDKIITQINSLESAMSKLQGKKVNVDIDVNVPKSANQIQFVMEEAANSAQKSANEISDSLIKAFSLNSPQVSGKVRQELREAVREMIAGYADAFDGSDFTGKAVDVFVQASERIKGIIRENGKVISADIGDDAAAASASYQAVWYRGVDGIKSKISELGNGELAGRAEEIIGDAFEGASRRAMNTVRGSFENALKSATNQITLDIEVNQEKIIRDIKNAINKATSIEYTAANVKIKVDKRNISDSVSKELESIDAGKLPQVAEAYERLFESLKSTHTVLSNSRSLNNVINALTRLANVDLQKFDVDRFERIGAAISSLAQTSDVSVVIARLVSSLAKLASVGDVVKTTSEHIPELGNVIKEAFDKIGSANVKEITERLLNAFTKLATSGKKAEAAANNLPGVTNEVKNFFDEMSHAPNVNETTLRMVEAFSNLATAGRNLSGVGSQVSGSLNNLNNVGSQTNSTFRSVSSGTNVVVEAFRKLASACGNAVKGIGSGAAKIVSHFRSIGNGGNHISKATISLKNLLQAALGFYGIRSAFNWGKQAIELASDLTEVQNVVENSFGSNGIALVERYAKSANESLGMTELTFKTISSRFQAMGNALGLTTGQIAEANAQMSSRLTKDYQAVGDGMGNMAIRLTKLAADIASFYNVEQQEAAEALNAIYTGQTRSLRRYGLDLTQATLQEYAHKQGIAKKVEEMTQAEKTLLRYQYVLSQTSNIQGDFARTADTWANQIRILKQNLQALAGVVGGTLINAFKPLITWLNKSISSIIAFFETTGNALGKIFGWKIVHTPASNAADEYDTLADSLNDYSDAANNAASANENLSGSTGGSSSGSGGKSSSDTSDTQDFNIDVVDEKDIDNVDSLSNSFINFADAADEAAASVDGLLDSDQGLADSLGDTGASGADAADAIENAQKAVEDYKNTILGFDELNVLNDVNESMSSDFDDIGKNASDLASNIKDLNLDTGNDIDSGSSTKDKTGTNNGSSSSSPSGSGASGGTGGNAIDGKGAEFMLTQGDSWIEYYKSSINSLFELGSYIGKALSEAMESIDWQSIYEKARGFGSGLASFLNGLISPRLFGNLGTTIANAINTVLNSAEAFLDRFNFKNLGNSLAAGINKFFSSFDFGLQARVFYKSINGIADTIKAAADHIEWNSIGTKISNCIRESLAGIDWAGKVYPAMASLGGGLAKFLNGLIKPATFSEIGKTIANTLNTALHFLDNFGSTFNFKNFGKSIATAISSFFNNWDANLTAKTFTTFASGALTAISSAIGGVKWERVGAKISGMLSNIEWGKLLEQVGKAIMTGVNAALDFAKGLFDGTPVEKAFSKLKTTINNIVNKIDFDKIKNGLKNILDVGLEFTAGFMEGFTSAMGALADIGVVVLSGIGIALGVIGDALNKMDPEWVRRLGEAIGFLAVGFGAIKAADKVAGIITSAKNALLGVGTAGTVAANGATAAATGTTAVGTASSSILGKVVAFGKEILKSTGFLEGMAIVGAVDVVSGMQRMGEESKGLNGKFSQMGGVMETLAVNYLPDLQDEILFLNDDLENQGATVDEASTAFAQFFKGKHIDPRVLQTALGSTKGSVSATAEQTELLDLIMAKFNGTVSMSSQKLSGYSTQISGAGKASGTAGDAIKSSLGGALDTVGTKTNGATGRLSTLISKTSEARSTASSTGDTIRNSLGGSMDTVETKSVKASSKISTFSTNIEKSKVMAEKASSIKTTYGGSLDTIATKSEHADKKSETFKTNLFTFAGGIAAQSILMAVMGATFKGVGDKADSAGGQITNFKGKISELVNSISSNSSIALTNSKQIGANIVNGMKGYMNDHGNDVSETARKVLVTNVQSSLKTAWGISGYSKITYDLGGSIVDGFKSAFNDQAGQVSGAISGLVNSMKTSLTNKIGEFRGAGKSMLESVKSGMEAVSFSNVPAGLLNSMNFRSLYSSMVIVGKNVTQSFINGMHTVHIPLPHLNFSYYVNDNGSGSYTYGYNTSIDWYKLGGFPNVGDLFIANEDAPEMVGRMGHRNVVANNMQITEGIKAAVVDGMMEVFMATNSNEEGLPYQFNIRMVMPDGEVLARQVEKGIARRDARYNTVAHSY